MRPAKSKGRPVWMLWHGGSSYAAPDQFQREDVEPFDSLAQAKDTFASRLHDRRFPCVSQVPPDDGGPTAHLHFADPFEDGDPYPDLILTFGPRGGLRCERA